MDKNEYIELFIKRAKGILPPMHCTANLVNMLNPIFRDGMTILDVGCGVGHYKTALDELGEVDYIGIDKDPYMVREGQKLVREIWYGNAEDLIFKDKLFDIVICYNLLLHLEFWPKAFEELMRVTKKWLFIRTLVPEMKQIIDGNLYIGISERDIEGMFKFGKGRWRYELIDDVVPGEYDTPQNYKVIKAERL